MNHLQVGSTGIGYEQKEITLTTSNEEGCEFSRSITVIFDFSYCSGIIDTGEEAGFRIVPNPNRGSFRILGEGNETLGSVSIYDATGRRIYDSPVMKGREEINIAPGRALPGIYFVHLRTQQDEVFREILVIH
jgi:hypothetical protein